MHRDLDASPSAPAYDLRAGEEVEGKELCTVGAVEDASAVMVTCGQGYMLQVHSLSCQKHSRAGQQRAA